MPTSLKLVPATDVHALRLAPHLKQADLDEIKAASGLKPSTLLIQSLALSTIKFAIVSTDRLRGPETEGAEEVIAIGGVVPYPHLKDAGIKDVTITDVGIPWAFTSDRVHEFPKSFHALSKEALSEMYKHFRVLTNFVDERNTSAIKWLKVLGFRGFETINHYGVEKRPFARFVQ